MYTPKYLKFCPTSVSSPNRLQREIRTAEVYYQLLALDSKLDKAVLVSVSED